MTKHRAYCVFSTACCLILSGLRSASAADFEFKDPKGVNSVQFLLDSEVEPIMGQASGVSGTIAFDPAAPEKTTGKIAVETESIHFQNQKMTDTLRQPDWLNTKQFTEITFAFKQVKSAKKSGENGFEMEVTGDFTCAGVTKELTVPVRATYLKGKAGERLQGAKGDLLVLRSEFAIKRSDFKIKPGMMNAVVAEDIHIRVSITGMHPEK